MSTKKIFTIAEAGKIIGYGKTKMYELINEGEIPAYKRGGGTVIHGTDIDAYLDNMPRYRPRK